MLKPRNVVLIMTLGLFSLPVLAADQGEHWLQYHPSTDIYRDIGSISGQSIQGQATATAPAGVKLPKFTGKPVLAQWSSPLAKNGKLWLAVDQSQKDGFYDRLYVDSNGNADLTDETPIKAKRSYQYGGEFGPVKVLLEGEDGPITYHLQFQFSGNQNRYHIYATTACWYEGTITAAGKKWRIMLIDYNANGTFNDAQTDRIGIAPAVETPTTTAAAPGQNSGDELFVALLGKYLQIDNAYFHPEPARDGAYIKLTDAGKVPVGKVRVNKEVSQFSASGENGLFRPRLTDGIGQIPTGTYHIFDWQIDRTDKDGSKWKLKGGNGGSGSPFTVTEGKETALAVGEPVKIALTATTEGQMYNFSQRLTGPLGENVELSRNGDTRAAPPTLHIVNKAGAYEKNLTFEFG